MKYFILVLVLLNGVLSPVFAATNESSKSESFKFITKDPLILIRLVHDVNYQKRLTPLVHKALEEDKDLTFVINAVAKTSGGLTKVQAEVEKLVNFLAYCGVCADHIVKDVTVDRKNTHNEIKIFLAKD